MADIRSIAIDDGDSIIKRKFSSFSNAFRRRRTDSFGPEYHLGLQDQHKVASEEKVAPAPVPTEEATNGVPA